MWLDRGPEILRAIVPHAGEARTVGEPPAEERERARKRRYEAKRPRSDRNAYFREWYERNREARCQYMRAWMKANRKSRAK